MSLFQHSVLNKYLQGLDEKIVNEAWGKFTAYFHNLEIQENIRNSKEEEYGGDFLTELFVNVLGYIKNPNPNFNLKAEQKNFTDSKKADGAILQDEKVISVIELKGMDTTDLGGKVEVQAFGYKNHQPEAVYVITSNFEKLRFYIDNAVDFEEFNLFKLTQDRFKILWLCLAKENVFNGIPKKIKDESLEEEELITKKLYRDYSTFKHEIFNSIVELNPQYDKLLLFKKTQKLLDRFLFIFFAEDRLLLPPNSIRNIIKQWNELKENYDEHFPLYDRYKKYFGYMNTGYKGKEHTVFAYNGGLFKSDNLLDEIKIDDEVLYQHSLKLSHYDFESEVSVNILGHIFEHSLNEIEEIEAELSATSKTSVASVANKGLHPLAKKVSKRKKDGVYYTPKYITKYIVENTVGKLCEEKKTELGIVEEEYKKERKGRRKTTLKKLIGKLEEYRKWLLELTICDPACGSGAFLIQALDFLINEHRYIDELNRKLLGHSIEFPNVEKSILENNLYGVDINDEAVEIAKLSLWLRTAHRGRKLTTLSNNIKCGNSLIDDIEIAGEKAFNWGTEFGNIFTEKEKQAFHITWVTHNSRVSQRMIDHKVKVGDAYWLSIEEEIQITKTILDIVKKDNLNVIAYNICGDHIHIILVCEESGLSNIVRKLKGKSSRTLHISKGINPLAQEKCQKSESLWAQKYSTTYIKSDEQLGNAVAYVKYNREKHALPVSKGLKPLAEKMCCDYEYAFRIEYKGGFDVVIGNPPYVRQELLGKNNKQNLINVFSEVGNGTADLYVYFYQLAINILKKDGIFSFITPNKWFKTKYGRGLRKYIKQFKINEIIDFFELKIFKDVSTEPQIIIVQNLKTNDSFLYKLINKTNEFFVNNYNQLVINKNELLNEEWVFVEGEEKKLLKKLYSNSITLSQYTNNGIKLGIKTALNDAFIISKSVKNKIIKNDPSSLELIESYANGTDILAWHLKNNGEYFFINTGYDIEISENSYSGIWRHLNNYYQRLSERQDKGKTPFNLRACAYYDMFYKPKIIFIHTAVNPHFYYDKENIFVNNNSYIIGNSDELLSAILNSKVFKYLKVFLFGAFGNASGKGRSRLNLEKMSRIPIPLNIDSHIKEKIIDRVNKQLNDNRDFQKLIDKFIMRLKDNFNIEKVSNKLETFYLYAFGTVIDELKRQKIIFRLREQDEWSRYFEEYKDKINQLQTEIDKTDREIDLMVYKLYGLTEREIMIVEGRV